MEVKMKAKKRKILSARNIILFLVVVLAGLFVWRLYILIFKKSADFRQRQAAVAVEIRPVETGTIRDVGQFSGSLIPRSQFVIAPKVSGKLKKLFVLADPTEGFDGLTVGGGHVLPGPRGFRAEVPDQQKTGQGKEQKPEGRREEGRRPAAGVHKGLYQEHPEDVSQVAGPNSHPRRQAPVSRRADVGQEGVVKDARGHVAESGHPKEGQGLGARPDQDPEEHPRNDAQQCKSNKERHPPAGAVGDGPEQGRRDGDQEHQPRINQAVGQFRGFEVVGEPEQKVKGKNINRPDAVGKVVRGPGQQPDDAPGFHVGFPPTRQRICPIIGGGILPVKADGAGPGRPHRLRGLPVGITGPGFRLAGGRTRRWQHSGPGYPPAGHPGTSNRGASRCKSPGGSGRPG